jgi:hypothetical protein
VEKMLSKEHGLKRQVLNTKVKVGSKQQEVIKEKNENI